MACPSPYNPKSNYHVRSNSLPTKPHPLVQQCNVHLCKLEVASSEATSSSSSSTISNKLGGLQDLHDCVEKLLQLPLTQQAFIQGRNQKWVDELLDGSLRLLDVCNAAKDAVIHTKECAREIQSIMRRRRGGHEVELVNEVRKYLASRKVVKKAIQKAQGNMKGVEVKRLNSNIESEAIAFVAVLKEIEAVTLNVFGSLLSFISGPKTQSKLNGWSLVSKLMIKKVGCVDQEGEVNEFEKVDAALNYIVCHDTTKSHDLTKHMESVQTHLQNLEMCVQDLEERLEFLFRRLIKTRVAVLNILSN